MLINSGFRKQTKLANGFRWRKTRNSIKWQRAACPGREAVFVQAQGVRGLVAGGLLTCARSTPNYPTERWGWMCARRNRGNREWKAMRRNAGGEFLKLLGSEMKAESSGNTRKKKKNHPCLLNLQLNYLENITFN